MKLTIILQKEVPDKETGQQLTNLVREKLADHPEINIIATCTDELKPEEG